MVVGLREIEAHSRVHDLTRYLYQGSTGLLAYKDVPKDRALNVAFRRWILTQLKDHKRKHAIVQACKRDVLFYANTFVWIYEPRTIPSCIPFISYDFQDELILEIVNGIAESVKPENSINRYDLLVEKSRTMGVTWSCLIPTDWYWRFNEEAHFKCISRGEDEVDQAGDLDALFPKLDYIEERMPNCLRIRGTRHDRYAGRSHLRVKNLKNGSLIVGESANPNAGRGGRNLAIFRDEEAFASDGEAITRAAQSTTKVMIRVSTPNGTGGSFHTARTKNSAKVLTLHWSKHPEYSKGLYSIKNGHIYPIDRDWHKKYRQDHDGKPYPYSLEPTHADPGVPWEFLRSPWFDAQCATADSPVDIAQELQISYLGSGMPFFDPHALNSTRTKYVMRPKTDLSVYQVVGKQAHKLGVQDKDNRAGRCRLWYNLIGDNKPPQSTTYTMGVDISAGTGASDSVVVVADDTTKQKVFEFVTNGMPPGYFAVIVKELYHYFTTSQGRAFLAWDQGGHGLTFGARIMEAGGVHVYYWKPADEKKGKKARRPGLPSNRQIKVQAFEAYRSELFHGPYVSHSYDEYAQAEQFEYDGRGGVIHAKARTGGNASDIGDQHGDVVTASVIMVAAMRSRPRPRAVQQQMPRGCYAWRRKQWKAEEARGRSMWEV